MAPDDGFFGERVAARYDAGSQSMFDPAVVAPAADRLAELARGGAALEFAVGTGRIALPLAERGVRVVGIDSSEAMLAQLREKPGAERIDARVGDMATTRVEGELHGRLPRLQHDLQPRHPGRPGRVFPERRRAPDAPAAGS